jgi:C-terminal processing protease CtpA/Prc
MCGVFFLFQQDKIVVDSVDEKSPAYLAGVRTKDVLVRICGKQPSELKPSAIRRLLSTEGKTVTMTLRRGNREFEVKFTLKEYD